MSARFGLGDMPWPEPLGGYGNPRFFNQYRTWLIPLLPYLALASSSSWGSSRLCRVVPWVAAGVAIGMWALYFRSAGRGRGYAVTLATLGYMAWRLPSAWRLAALTASTAAVGYGLCLFLCLFAEHSQATHLLATDLNGRAALWQRAIEMTLRHPVLGNRPMSFASQPDMSAAHPHNTLLLWSSEYGLLFTVSAVFLIARALFYWLRLAANRSTADPRDRDTALRHTALSASLVAGVLHAIVSCVTVMPLSQLMTVGVAGKAMGEYFQHHGLPTPPTAGWAKRSLAVCVVISVVYLRIFIASPVVYPSHATATPHADGSHKPRFWQDGSIPAGNMTQ